jgi:hypothetical protein
MNGMLLEKTKIGIKRSLKMTAQEIEKLVIETIKELENDLH